MNVRFYTRCGALAALCLPMMHCALADLAAGKAHQGYSAERSTETGWWPNLAIRLYSCAPKHARRTASCLLVTLMQRAVPGLTLPQARQRYAPERSTKAASRVKPDSKAPSMRAGTRDRHKCYQKLDVTAAVAYK